MFIFQSAIDRTPLDLKNISIDPIYSSYTIAKFDLTLSAYEYNNGIELGFEYENELFENATIERIAKHFKELIDAIISNPFQSIYSAALLTKEEQQQMLVEWNDSNVDYQEKKMYFSTI